MDFSAFVQGNKIRGQFLGILDIIFLVFSTIKTR